MANVERSNAAPSSKYGPVSLLCLLNEYKWNLSVPQAVTSVFRLMCETYLRGSFGYDSRQTVDLSRPISNRPPFIGAVYRFPSPFCTSNEYQSNISCLWLSPSCTGCRTGRGSYWWLVVLSTVYFRKGFSLRGWVSSFPFIVVALGHGGPSL